MSRIVVSTDSISDLGDELIAEYNIPVLPLVINMGSDSFPDAKDMPQRIYDYVEKTKKLPKTATRSVEDYKEFYQKHKPANGELIHFTISSKLSASYSLAETAAKEMEGVHVIDSYSLSTGSGLSVLYAADLAKEGKLTASEIAVKCRERVNSVQASFLLDSLDFLHKGGRCSGLAVIFASVLKIKPMIKLQDGAMGPGKKYRGNFNALVDKYVDDILEQFNTPDLERCFVTYTTAPDGMAEKVKERVLAKFPFKKVHITQAGGTITSHCGKNTLGILYFNDGK